MTKRKRDVFTVIEAINNWFEASENPITPTTDLEGSPSCFDSGCNTESEAPVANCTVPAPGSVGDPVPWKELGHGSFGSAQLGVGSEVAEKDAIYPADESRVSGEAEAGTERGPADIGEPGSSGEGIQPIHQLDTEVKEEAEVNFASFWDVLRSAGYDVW